MLYPIQFAIAVGILFIIQLCYYGMLYFRIYNRNRQVKGESGSFSAEQPPLSVIVLARNGEQQLRRNLISILEQDYPDFDVVVVNDGNEDDSDIYLKRLSAEYPHLHYSFLPQTSRNISHKKLALMLGIRAGKHDWVVVTEADCRPVGNQWLKLLARNFTPDTEIVLGYCGYESQKGWRHKLIAYHTLFNAMRYLGLALARFPYMGIGNNLAYRKELFFRGKGFSEYLYLQRGDDDLFVNSNATRRNTRVETAQEAVVHKEPIDSAKTWREDRVSYMETSRLYKGMQRYLLGCETLTRLLFYVATVACIVMSIIAAEWWVLGGAVLVYILRFLLQIAAVNLTAKSLGEAHRYYLSLPILDLIQAMQSMRWKLIRMVRNEREFMR
ncbi:MAG: glycosyltransferase [Prevotellaceae bacterium]|jgi:cellulose synthase/poly-beta-1,6-N-acetylglucosamine synthase-like glycosyltransferase|nr:glycosyltransferase [Prevotellaceae bacterium]